MEKPDKKTEKQDRLAAQLRANLQKRKAQMRARRNSEETRRADLPDDLSKDRVITPDMDKS